MKLKVKELKTFKERLLGLIGSDKPYPVMFKTRFGIHTFGLKYPIDILILNKQNKIVRLLSSLSINRIFIWSPIYNTVIELPEGFIVKNKLKLEDAIQLILE